MAGEITMKACGEELEKIISAIENGNWNVVKPHSCVPPREHVDSYTYVLTHTEDQMNTSVLDKDSSECASYDTADSSLDEPDDIENDLELNKFMLAEMLVNEQFTSLTNGMQPNASDEVIFCDDKGKFHRLSSALSWKRLPSDNRRMDCALQINASEFTPDQTCQKQCPHWLSSRCCGLEGSVCEDTMCQSHLDAQDSTCSYFNNSASQIITTRNAGDGLIIKPNISDPTDDYGCTSNVLKDHDSEHKTADGLISRIGHLLRRDADSDPQLVGTCLTKPLKLLSKDSQHEINAFLKEAAESLDVADISLDESKSSIQLLQSIIAEAGRRLCLRDIDWRREDTVTPNHESAGGGQGAKALSRHTGDSKRGSMQSFIPRPVALNDRGSRQQNNCKNSYRNGCLSSPLPQLQDANNLPKKSKSHPTTQHCPSTDDSTKLSISMSPKAQKDSEQERSRRIRRSLLRKVLEEAPLDGPAPSSAAQLACSALAKWLNKPYRLKRSRLDLQKKECKPEEASLEEKVKTEFFSCRQVHHATRGNQGRRRHRHRCNCRERSNASVSKELKVPCIEQFTTSTKSGQTCYFEILRTKISVPSNNTKRTIVGATIPIPLQSEAMWTNGELSVQVKEIDKDTVHLPVTTRRSFTKLPHTISIDFVREYRQEKLGQQLPNRSPVVVRRTPQPDSRNPLRPEQSPHRAMCLNSALRPFNTKVDFIHKKDPLVLGTLDRRKMFSKKMIKQQKLNKTDIAAYCVV